MKVLHVIPSLSATEGGPSKALPLIARTLHGRGIAVTIATTDDAGPGQRSLDLTNCSLETDSGFRHYFAKQTDFYKISLPLAKWVRTHVREFDIVNIHALFSFTSVSAASSARRANIPYVIRPLGVLNHYGVSNRRRILKKLSLRWREAELLRDAAAVHFTSSAEQEEAESLGIPMRSAVIPLGIPMAEEVKPSPSLGDPYVLYLSRIDPKKNIESLLKGWSGLEPDIQKKWKLRIAGSGDPDYVARLKNLASTLSLSDSVEWVGYVEGERKEEILKGASLFVLPSFSENFGIAAVEAMAAGIPSILAKGVAAGTEAGNGNACVVIEPDAESVRVSLSTLISDPELRTRLGLAGHDFVKRVYSLEGMGASLENLYREILS